MNRKPFEPGELVFSSHTSKNLSEQILLTPYKAYEVINCYEGIIDIINDLDNYDFFQSYVFFPYSPLFVKAIKRSKKPWS